MKRIPWKSLSKCNFFSILKVNKEPPIYWWAVKIMFILYTAFASFTAMKTEEKDILSRCVHERYESEKVIIAYYVIYAIYGLHYCYCFNWLIFFYSCITRFLPHSLDHIVSDSYSEHIFKNDPNFMLFSKFTSSLTCKIYFVSLWLLATRNIIPKYWKTHVIPTRKE